MQELVVELRLLLDAVGVILLSSQGHVPGDPGGPVRAHPFLQSRFLSYLGDYLVTPEPI